jgi:hypothetical protein
MRTATSATPKRPSDPNSLLDRDRTIRDTANTSKERPTNTQASADNRKPKPISLAIHDPMRSEGGASIRPNADHLRIELLRSRAIHRNNRPLKARNPTNIPDRIFGDSERPN